MASGNCIVIWVIAARCHQINYNLKKSFVLLLSVFFITSLFAQRQGADTLIGYIIRSNDTIPGRIILSYKMVKEKKEFQKEYESEQWYRQVKFIDQQDSGATLTPEDISAYGWKWNDTTKAIFQSTNVIIPHKGAFSVKGNGNRFLKLEIDGPMSLYLYHHKENVLSGAQTFNDRYLKNEKGDFEVLKIKVVLGFSYNLKNQESWFEDYPGLSKFNLKDMLPFEVWLLVAGYNDWKKSGH